MSILLSAQDVAAIVATLLLGLSAGLFFAYSVSVVPGLRDVGDVASVLSLLA